MLIDGQTFDLPIDELLVGRFNIGSVEEVIERIKMYRDRMGISEMGVRL